MIWPLTAGGGASTGGSSWRPSGGSNLEMLSDAVMMDIYVIYIYGIPHPICIYIYIDHEQCKFGRVCYAMRHEDAWVVMDCRLGHLEPPRLLATSSCTSPAAVWQKLSATDPKSSGRKVRPTKHTSYLQATCRKLMETDHDMVWYGRQLLLEPHSCEKAPHIVVDGALGQGILLGRHRDAAYQPEPSTCSWNAEKGTGRMFCNW